MNNPMMTNMSSKFTSLQRGISSNHSNVPTPTVNNPTMSSSAPSTDWKKWGKRAAIGVAGIGALALGVDAAGDMMSGISGMEAFDGGGGGFDASGMDAQTAIDANAAQLGMEQMGQENAMMLLDPVGTTCKFSYFPFL